MSARVDLVARLLARFRAGEGARVVAGDTAQARVLVDALDEHDLEGLRPELEEARARHEERRQQGRRQDEATE